MPEAIAAMKRAYAALSSGRAEVPLRTRLPVAPHDGLSLLMPAYLDDPSGEALAVKVVSLFPGNPARGLATIQAAVLVLEADTGRMAAVLEGSRLTAIRTGAASGAATDLLARADSRTAAVFGAGVQGRTQLEAVCTVRSIQTAWIYDPNPAQANALVAELAGRSPIPADLHIALTPQQAVAEADILCTATTSSQPVFTDAWLKPGVHINAVGAYTPQMQEIPFETVRRARVFVDSLPACLAEAGDLLQPISQGLYSAEQIAGELGQLISGNLAGRTSTDQVTLFKSVGVAVQDAAAAMVALKNALRLGLGQEVSW
jgi:ornithine cyclodeaminase